MRINRQHWGKLTVLGKKRVPWMREGPNGPYDSGDTLDYLVKLGCSCGNEFVVSDAEFKGIHVVHMCDNCLTAEKEAAEAKLRAKQEKALAKVKPVKEPKPIKEPKPMGRPKRPGTMVAIQLTLEEMVLLAQYTEEKNEIEVALKLAITEYLQLKALL